MEYYKDYYGWIKLQQVLDSSDNSLFTEKEIWWTALGINIGVEIDGKNKLFERPVVIIRRFNKDAAWVAPLTTTMNIYDHIHVTVTSPGIDVGSVAVLNQLRMISSKRLLRKEGVISDEQFFQIITKTHELFPKSS